MPRNTYTKEQVDVWVERYANGETTIEIATSDSVPISSVNYKLKGRGVAFRPSHARPTFITPEEKLQAARDRSNRYARKPENKVKNAALGKVYDDFRRSLKAKPCMDCGVQYQPYAMEFDHRPGENKSFLISTTDVRREELLAEVAKCDVVCVLCHRLRTESRHSRKDGACESVMHRRKYRARVRELKKAPCVQCGKTYHPCQMDFDHIDPATKLDSVCNMVNNRRQWELIETEIAKCRLLCVMCHKDHTEIQRTERLAARKVAQESTPCV